MWYILLQLLNSAVEVGKWSMDSTYLNEYGSSSLIKLYVQKQAIFVVSQVAHNSSLLIPFLGENTKEQSTSLEVTNQGLGSSALSYIELPAHLPLRDSKLGEK